MENVTIIDENYEGVEKIHSTRYIYDNNMYITGDVHIKINLIITGDQIIEGDLFSEGYQEIHGDQIVKGDQEILGWQLVHRNQEIHGNQELFSWQIIKGYQEIHGNQEIQGYQIVEDYQKVKGNQYVAEYQKIHGYQLVTGVQKVLGNQSILGVDTKYSRHFLTSEYPVYFVRNHIKIGCKMYTRKKWKSFTDEEIDKMDFHALWWWKKWRTFILSTSKELDKTHKKL